MKADSEKIIWLLEESNITRYRISKETKIPQATLSDIATGKTDLKKIQFETAAALTEFAENVKERKNMQTRNELITRILKGRELLADVNRTGNDRKAVKGNIKDWTDQLRNSHYAEADSKDEPIWVRDTYYVQATPFDYDLNKLEVITFDDEIIGSIVADNLKDLYKLYDDLDHDADVHGWADGQGGEIEIPGRK